MIPKIIHYCWFGGNPLPEDAKHYIETWKKYCSDYKIKEWNEKNFNLNCNQYVKEAYENKKWAFITDYVRLYAMVNEGGIYMDTDVELVKPLDPYLKHQAFSGFETDSDIPTGIMASEKNFPLFEELLHEYDNRPFVLQNGQLDLTANVYVITQTCLKHGLVQNNQLQDIEGFIIYPKDYFCPKDHKTGVICRTTNTVAIHHFAGSWVTGKARKWMEIEQKYRKKGKKVYNIFFDSKIGDVIKKIYIRDIKTNYNVLKRKIFKL